MTDDKLTLRQRLALNIGAAVLRLGFSDLRNAIEGPLADKAYGPKAPWSNLARRRMVDTQVANVGACVMCLYLDGPAQEPWIIIGERPDPVHKDRTLYNGSGGGFANLLLNLKERAKLALIGIDTDEDGEQPRETAAREWSEENLTPDGQPLFLLDPAQLHLIDIGRGIDYAPAQKGGLPTAYSMHYTVLTDAQRDLAKQHAARMADPAYRAACAAQTGNETSRFNVLRLDDAASLQLDSFAYVHEALAVRQLHKLYKAGRIAL